MSIGRVRVAEDSRGRGPRGGPGGATAQAERARWDPGRGWRTGHVPRAAWLEQRLQENVRDRDRDRHTHAAHPRGIGIGIGIGRGRGRGRRQQQWRGSAGLRTHVQRGGFESHRTRTERIRSHFPPISVKSSRAKPGLSFQPI